MAEKYFIQNRWKLEDNKLYYYGLRSEKNLFKNSVKLSSAEIKIISSLPKILDENEVRILNKYTGKQVVTEKELRHIPSSLSEATFCKNCCANDYIIPGLEFDENGICPMCQTAFLQYQECASYSHQQSLPLPNHAQVSSCTSPPSQSL